MALAATTSYVMNLLRTSPTPPPDTTTTTASSTSTATPTATSTTTATPTATTTTPTPTTTTPTTPTTATATTSTPTPTTCSTSTPTASLLKLSASLRSLETAFFAALPLETLESIKPQIPSDLRHEGEILFLTMRLKKAVLITLPPCTVPRSLLVKVCGEPSTRSFLEDATSAGWLSPSQSVMLSDLYAAMVLHPLFSMFWQDLRPPHPSTTPSPVIHHHHPTPSSASSDPNPFSLTFRKVMAHVTSPTTETFGGSWVLWDPLDPSSDADVAKIFFRADAWAHRESLNPLPSPPPEARPSSRRRKNPPPIWDVSEADLARLLDYPGTLPSLEPSTSSSSSSSPLEQRIEEFVEVAYLDRRRRMVTRPVASPASPRSGPGVGGARGRGGGRRGGGRGSRRGRSTTPRHVAGSAADLNVLTRTVEPRQTQTGLLGETSAVLVRHFAGTSVSVSSSASSSSSSSLSADSSEDDTFFEGEDEEEWYEEVETDQVEEVEEEELVLVTTFGAVRSEMPRVFEHFKEYRKACKGVMDLAIWTSLEE
ncbi:hypothetical protein HDU67_008767 [Dinochytrium kinnereticum]|nr:hypothetical protein HDU67_008767 [Dinochytrium kinnereticum]